MRSAVFGDDLSRRVLRYLTEISQGRLSLTVEDAMAEPDRDVQRMLHGFVYLHEELAYREEASAARVAAEASDRAKSAFLATMSHELRTPLNAIIGYTEIVQEDAVEWRDLPQCSEMIEDLDRINGAARHLLSLVNDILDLAKIEAGQVSAALGPVDVVPLLDELRATLAPLAQQRGLQLCIEAQPMRVQSSRRLLLQCLINLGANAMKFTEEGHVTVRAFTETASFGFLVEDTGRGMTPGELRRVLEPFAQVRPGEAGGTGLGLTITRRLVDHLGGDLSMESAPGQGTRIRITFPH
ncbi:MAG: HAMP domain-containing sensor histidine kinase [Myxococcota bacterium]